MRELAARTYFAVCLLVGRLLRASKYSKVEIVVDGGERFVRKRRSFHAPLLVWLCGLLFRLLDTGVRVLPQREWVERERGLYRRLHGASIRVEGDGTLVLPCLAGVTLASVLEDPSSSDGVRRRAIELAAVALRELHRQVFTHGDAMAENVLVDIHTGVARWFDFETVHEPGRPMAWRRADDLRALVVTCVVRTIATRRAEVVRLILNMYADDGLVCLLLAAFASALRRPHIFHLAQAPLSQRCLLEIAGLLRETVGPSMSDAGGVSSSGSPWPPPPDRQASRAFRATPTPQRQR